MNPVVRRIPDEHGTLVTYLPAIQIGGIVGVTGDTVRRWMRAGAVRTTTRLRGTTSVAVVDAAIIRKMSGAEKRAAAMLTPAHELVASRTWRKRVQSETLLDATNLYEVWDDYDLCRLLALYESGISHEEIAKELGRTLEGVGTKVHLLRLAGELPPIENDDGWWDRTRVLLTSEEVERVTER